METQGVNNVKSSFLYKEENNHFRFEWKKIKIKMPNIKQRKIALMGFREVGKKSLLVLSSKM